MRVETLLRSLLRLTIAGVACIVSAGLNGLRAQGVRVTPLDFATGSEFEDYLRVLQIAGKVPLYPWSIRGFSPLEIDSLTGADSLGVWKLRVRHGNQLSIGSVNLTGITNSNYPYGANDGPVWAGRGITGVASGGFAARLGPFSLLVNPLVFRTSNQGFPLLKNGNSGRLAFNHGSYPNSIDLPQRFGNDAYGRVDPGASTFRFDSRFVTAGVSTANQWIGPATEFPFLLGTNAPGFPHLFLGTGNPLNIGVARVHMRVNWGKLYQSEYSPVEGPERYNSVSATGTTRLSTSATLLIMPRGLTGLELGFARFHHLPFAPDQPNGRFWKKPFEGLFYKGELASSDSTLNLDNQLASFFFRWVFPSSGIEIFGERGYDDHFYDLRDFFQDTDHNREYMLGFQKVLHLSLSKTDVLKGELVNYELPNLAQVRGGQGSIYLGSFLRQGHTNRGQLLGASAGAGTAAASTLTWSRYAPNRRTALTLRRIVKNQRGAYAATGIEDLKSSDVVVAMGVEQMRLGRRADFGLRVDTMNEFNRNFTADFANLNIQFTTRLHPWQ